MNYTYIMFSKKSIVSSNEIKSHRVFKLNQFLNIYNHIKQQSEVLKSFETIQSKCDSPSTSKLYDTFEIWN